ncbi:17616_t:CDS:1, partial [Cetraspora pellucida]
YDHDKGKKLWDDILNILGYRILKAGSISSTFRRGSKELTRDFGRKVTGIKDISKCNIYASIMNENNKKAFSLHVDYRDR